MEMLDGTSLFRGVAIAAAARVETQYGVASLSTERLRQCQDRLRKLFGDQPEPDEIILVGSAIPNGFVLSLPLGLKVIGLATEERQQFLPAPDCPTVIGLGDELLRSVAENDIVIVDGDRGRVYLNPDAMVIARYQAPLQTTRRFFLDPEHSPAHTASDNTRVTVLACVSSRDELQGAMAQGADGIYLPAENEYFGDDTLDAETQFGLYRELFTHVAGLPIFLAVPSENLSMAALSRGAAEGALHLVLDDPNALEDIQEQMRWIEASFEEDETLFGTVHWESLLLPSEETDLPDSIAGFAGIVTWDFSDAATSAALMEIAGLARRADKPAAVMLPAEGWELKLDRAVQIGYTRVIGAPDQILQIKEVIRTL